MKRIDTIRRLKAEHGSRGFVLMTRDLLEGKKLPNGKEIKLRPDQFSLRALWEGLVGDPEETLPTYRGSALFVDLTEAVDASAFVAVTKLLLASKVIEGYNEIPGIGDSLVTPMPSSRRLENVAGFSDLEGLKEVKEGAAYEDSSIGDKYVTTEALKKGRLLSISEEAIMEDQTGQLLVRAGGIGRLGKQDREKTIVHGVVDKNSKVHRPSGTATALYSTANKNLVGDAATPGGSPFNAAIALEDWTDIQEILQYHGENMKTDPQAGDGEPMLWNPSALLVPSGLVGSAMRIKTATKIESILTNQRTTFDNPMAGRYDVLSSPYVGSSGLSGAASDWYFGEFKSQFYWQDIWPLQVFRQDNTGPEAFIRDVVTVFKIRYLGGIFASDHRRVVKVKGA